MKLKRFADMNESNGSNPGVDVKPGKYDGQDIAVWTVKAAEGKEFGNWEEAMDFLIDLWKKDEDLFNYFRGELGTGDDVIVGNQQFAGIDVQDHMKLAESAVNEYDRGYVEMLDENIPLHDDAEIRAAVKKFNEENRWEPDAVMAFAYMALVDVNYHEMAKEFVELVKKH